MTGAKVGIFLDLTKQFLIYFGNIGKMSYLCIKNRPKGR